MRRVAFLAVVVCLAVVLVQAGLARGEIVYVEDFENDGEPGFDPMFLHDIGALPHSESEAYWNFYEEFFEYGIVLGLAPAQDSIRFALPAGQEVVYAAVDARGVANPYHPDYYSIEFIGKLSSETVCLPSTSGYRTIGKSSAQIGPITEIQLRGIEGLFDNITIHVVPEPSAVVVVGGAIAVWCFGRRF